MGGKSSSSETTQKSEPWAAQQPYLKEGFQQAQDIYNSGGPDFYSGATYVPFSQQSEAALGMMEGRALAGSPLNQMAQQYGADTLSGNYFNVPQGAGQAGSAKGFTYTAQGLSPVDDVNAQTGFNDTAQNTLTQTAQGDFLNANPYVDQMYDMAASSVGRNYQDSVVPSLNATFASGGRTGSRAQTDAFANSQRELGDTLNNLSTQTYYQNYLNERQNQLGAANQLGQFGQQAADRDMTAQRSNQAMQDALRQYEMAARAGSAGNQTQASIANANNQTLASNNLLNYFNSERNRQQDMSQIAPQLANLDYADMERLYGVGQAVEGKAGEVLQDDMNRYNFYQNRPEENLANYIAAIQGNYGGTTRSRGPGQSGLSQAGDAVSLISSIAGLFG